MITAAMIRRDMLDTVLKEDNDDRSNFEIEIHNDNKNWHTKDENNFRHNATTNDRYYIFWKCQPK